ADAFWMIALGDVLALTERPFDDEIVRQIDFAPGAVVILDSGGAGRGAGLRVTVSLVAAVRVGQVDIAAMELPVPVHRHAVTDAPRRGILANLALGDKSIGELAEPFAMTFAGASKHVRVLEDAGLLSRRKVGRTHLMRLEAKPLEEAERWLKQWEKFWTV